MSEALSARVVEHRKALAWTVLFITLVALVRLEPHQHGDTLEIVLLLAEAAAAASFFAAGLFVSATCTLVCLFVTYFRP